MAKGKTAALLSKPNLIKTAFAAAVTIFVFKKLEASANDSTAKGGITSKVAGVLGFKGPGIEA